MWAAAVFASRTCEYELKLEYTFSSAFNVEGCVVGPYLLTAAHLCDPARFCVPRTATGSLSGVIQLESDHARGCLHRTPPELAFASSIHIRAVSTRLNASAALPDNVSAWFSQIAASSGYQPFVTLAICIVLFASAYVLERVFTGMLLAKDKASSIDAGTAFEKLSKAKWFV